MNTEILVVEPSIPLQGTVELTGAKNAALVIIIATLLAPGISTLKNIPDIADVHSILLLMESLGAKTDYCRNTKKLTIDTTYITTTSVETDMMRKTRASILIMGTLIARCGKAEVSLPGGDAIGARPIDFHLKGLKKLGIAIEQNASLIYAERTKAYQAARIVLEYPSVGATENILLAATAAQGKTIIVNAAIEPEIIDLISLLNTMGASISIESAATICIIGGKKLMPITYTIMVDRLEAGTLLIAAAITGGSIYLPNGIATDLDIVLLKLEEMGHSIAADFSSPGIRLHARKKPRAVSIKTGPYPNFPTDLQAPFLVALCLSQGKAVVEETVFENRLAHVYELIHMGAHIEVSHNKAIVSGVPQLHGFAVKAHDIRASGALVLAGLAASDGITQIDGLSHWKRGYEGLDTKLNALGACIYKKTKAYDNIIE